MAKVVEESLHICHILLPKLPQHLWNLVPRLEWEANEGYRREPGKVNEQTSQENGQGEKEVDERFQSEEVSQYSYGSFLSEVYRVTLERMKQRVKI